MGRVGIILNGSSGDRSGVFSTVIPSRIFRAIHVLSSINFCKHNRSALGHVDLLKHKKPGAPRSGFFIFDYFSDKCLVYQSRNFTFSVFGSDEIASFFGNNIVKVPFLYVASIFVASTKNGIFTTLENIG